MKKKFLYRCVAYRSVNMKIFSVLPVQRQITFGNGAAASSAACTAAADSHRYSNERRDSYNREMQDAVNARARYEADKARDRARTQAYYAEQTAREISQEEKALAIINPPKDCKVNIQICSVDGLFEKFIRVTPPEKSKRGYDIYKLYDYYGNLCREYTKDDKEIKHAFIGGYKTLDDIIAAIKNSISCIDQFKISKAIFDASDDFGKDSDIIKKIWKIYHAKF